MIAALHHVQISLSSPLIAAFSPVGIVPHQDLPNKPLHVRVSFECPQPANNHSPPMSGLDTFPLGDKKGIRTSHLQLRQFNFVAQGGSGHLAFIKAY